MALYFDEFFRYLAQLVYFDDAARRGVTFSVLHTFVHIHEIMQHSPSLPRLGQTASHVIFGPPMLRVSVPATLVCDAFPAGEDAGARSNVIYLVFRGIKSIGTKSILARQKRNRGK